MKAIALLLASVTLATGQATEYQISGVVVDHLTNRPLSHVLVEISTVGRSNGGDASVLTEDDGRFTFLHVPKGKYNLQAQKRGQFPQAFHASDGGYSTAIVVDGRLKTDGLVFPLRSDASIHGTVLGDDGEPVRNVQVQLFRENVVDGEAQTVPANSSITNSSGLFHFGHLDGGKYYLAASGTPWFAGQGAPEVVYPVTFYGDTTEAAGARSILLAEGATAEAPIALHLVPGIHVKIPTHNQGFTLSVAGPGGMQIPVSTSMRASSNGASHGYVFNGSRPRQSDVAIAGNELQNMELVNLAAGRYQVSSYGSGGQSQHSQTVDLADGSTLLLDSTAAGSFISGRVIFDTPKPEGELNIFLSGHGNGMMASVATDGTFKFEKTSGGTMEVVLNSPTMVETSIEAKGARLVHDRLEVPSSGAVELTIHAQASDTTASVDGYAVQNDAAVAGAMVLLIPQDLGRVRLIRRDQSDADGSFTLANVLPGRYTVVAIDDGHDLAYKDEKVIGAYINGGVAVTIPLKSKDPIRVPVQPRKP